MGAGDHTHSLVNISCPSPMGMSYCPSSFTPIGECLLPPASLGFALQGVANLPWLFAVANRTHQIIRQNMVLALAAVVAATLPTVAGVLPLSMAVLVHEGSTLLVVLNSLRLLLDPGESATGWALKGGWRSALETLKAPHDHHSHDHHAHDHNHHHSHDHHAHDHHNHSHDHHHHHHPRSHDHHHHSASHSHSHSHNSHKHEH
uniref:Uncharacterized protein n=1 Tax=Dunaliella tertiolecta TaxID=3047 RepID=A0A7S3VRY6_DUNTE